jgi:Ser/Thr protein kinase RdoA (MazF antagonist)
MGQIGSLMAKLHRYSRLSSFPLDNANQHGPEVLDRDVRILRDALDYDLLPASDYEIVSGATRKIQEVMERLGKSKEVWGPVHGDIHYDNLVLAGEEIYPIDFTELVCAHYLYDLGVTLYHTLHQGATMRQAFLQGYQQIELLPLEHLQYLDAFITFAAINNIAWNATLPEQVASALFRKNLHQLVHTFCRHLMAESSFLEAESQ